MTRALLIMASVLLLCGCGAHGVDSHTEVFKTPEQASAERLATQLKEHKDLAVSVLKFSRPDLQAKAGDGASVVVSADGVSQSIDLTPVEGELLKHSNEERNILRRYLAEQLRGFDVERLRAIGFERSRPWISYDLVNGRTLDEMQKAAGESKLAGALVLTNLYRVTVVRRTEPAVTTPVTAAILEGWNATAARADEAAEMNLREAIRRGELFTTLAYGGIGRSGTLSPGVPPAVIVLPEFLAAVRKAWGSSDNVVLFAPGAGAITFTERRNERLLNVLAPQWRKTLATAKEPLCDQLLLRDDKGLSLFSYEPAGTSRPATKPATKEAPYIVH
jgi:hypothetical protein